MKKYILSLALCTIVLCNFAQIQSYKIVSQADEERVILPYDSLTNITRNNLPSLIGQKIQILTEIGLAVNSDHPTPSIPATIDKNAIHPGSKLTIS